MNQPWVSVRLEKDLYGISIALTIRSLNPTGVVERFSCASLVSLCWIFDGAYEQCLQTRWKLIVEFTLHARPLII